MGDDDDDDDDNNNIKYFNNIMVSYPTRRATAEPG